jgi:outer membrane lipoprotein-sorting protein
MPCSRRDRRLTSAAMITRRSILLAMTALGAPVPAFAQGVPAPAGKQPVLNEQDRADVARIEAYLNALRTLTARFVQVAEQGGVAEGRIYLQRPGRLRLEYADPVPLLVVAARGQIIQHDRQLKQTTYLPLSSTPAAILLRENVTLSGSVTVTGIERGPNSVRVTLVQTDDPRAGRLTLAFAERPLQLTNWVVVDGQGATTRVALSEIQNGVQIPSQLFEFRDEPQSRN